MMLQKRSQWSYTDTRRWGGVRETDTDACAVQGGNDYEIFMSPKTKGHSVTSPKDTQQQCTTLFIKPAEQIITPAAADE